MAASNEYTRCLLRHCFGSDAQRVVSSCCGVGKDTLQQLFDANNAVMELNPVMSVNETDILLALHFLRCYPTADQAQAFWRMSPKTYREHVSKALIRLDSLLPEVSK